MKKFYRVLITLFFLGITIILISVTLGKTLLEGQESTLKSFILLHFGGYLFFLIMPVEALVPYYTGIGYNKFLILILALITAILAQLLDYGIGRLTSHDIITKLIGKKKFERGKKYIDNYGLWALFFFNLLPISSPILTLIAGMMRVNLKKVLYYSIPGLLIKYLVLIYFWHSVF